MTGLAKFVAPVHPRFGTPVHVACRKQHLPLVEMFFRRQEELLPDLIMLKSAQCTHLVDFLHAMACERALDEAAWHEVVYEALLYTLRHQAESWPKAKQLLALLPRDFLTRGALIKTVFVYSDLKSDVRLELCALLVQAARESVLAESAEILHSCSVDPAVVQILFDTGLDINLAMSSRGRPLMDEIVKDLDYESSPRRFEVLLMCLMREGVHFNLDKLEQAVKGEVRAPVFTFGSLRPRCPADETALSSYHLRKRYFPIFSKLLATKQTCRVCMEFCAMTSGPCGHVVLCLTCKAKVAECPQCVQKF
jgi:hypothetical protein